MKRISKLLVAAIMLLPVSAVAQYNPLLPLPTLGVTLNDSLGMPLPDTVFTNSGTLVVTAEPRIPAKFFNGTYQVEQIPYSPYDTSFWLNGLGQQVAITSDDRFTPSINIPFPFYFFGQQKTSFRLGDNGILSFSESFQLDSPGIGSDFCPYNVHNPIPWTEAAGTTPGDGAFHRMHDAIYGVYEDLYFGPNGAYLSGNQGVWYGIMGEFPNRVIVCTFKGVPVYYNTNVRQIYQMVCYEGSNIIEVHVKHRGCCPSTSDAVIGIQNATGLPQQPGAVGTSTMEVVPNSPAAFWPTGCNLLTTVIDTMSFRFTPMGNTSLVYHWLRITDAGVDTLTDDSSNPNDYYIPMDASSSHPTLTRLVVPASQPATYVLNVSYQDCGGVVYSINDTLVVADQPYVVEALSSDETMGVALGSGLYQEGSTATLMALAARDHAFRGWSDGSDDNPYSLTVTSDTSLMAIFSPMCADTVYVHDTVYVGIDEVKVLDALIYVSDGQIVVEAGDSQLLLPEVTVYDAAGRMLSSAAAGKAQSFRYRVPASGTYLVKVGSASARRLVIVR